MEVIREMCMEIADRIGHHWYDGDFHTEWSMRTPPYALVGVYNPATRMFDVFVEGPGGESRP
jgi:hypothetical protein